VVEKFKKDWTCSWERRPCPAVNFVFKVTNNIICWKRSGWPTSLRAHLAIEGCRGSKFTIEQNYLAKSLLSVTQEVVGYAVFQLESGLDPHCIITNRFQ
jgi:hypothetical protein